MRQRKQPILDHFIQASIEGGHTDGHFRELVYSGVEEEERAREIRRSLFRSAKHLGVSLKADLEQDPVSGNWSIRYHAIDKGVGRAFIRAKTGGDPSKLDYNPYMKGA